MQPLKVQLFPKNDTDGQVFYIGKLCFPGTITLGRGCVFFVYLDGEMQELHICPTDALRIDDPAKYYTRGRRKQARSRHNNIAIELEPSYSTEENDEDKKFFSGSMAADVSVNASEGIVFLVFVADSGEEELQISVTGSKKDNKKRKKHTIIEKNGRSGPEFEVFQKRAPKAVDN